MAQFRVLIFLNPIEGREDEFNAWYEKTHLDDVLQTTGLAAAQRWGLEKATGMEMPLSHLALYEAEAESAQEISDRLNSTRHQRAMSEAMDMSKFAIWIFSELGERHVLELDD